MPAKSKTKHSAGLGAKAVAKVRDNGLWRKYWNDTDEALEDRAYMREFLY